MGIHLSKKATSSNPTITNNLNCTTVDHLTSYETACKMDADLQSFDTTLQTRTRNVISSLAEGVEVKALSFESLKQTTECLLELNQEVVKVILDCKKDIWKNQELFNLVEEYFDNSLKTLDFCVALEKCIERATDRHLLVTAALHNMESDKYPDAFDDTFKDTSTDPFTEDFFRVFRSVYMHQTQMLEKLQLKKSKLDSRLKRARSWRRLSSVVFAAAFAAVMICSVVASAISAPPAAAAIAAAIPVGSVGKWMDSVLRSWESAARGQKEIVNSMSVGAYVAIKDLENIRAMIGRLEVDVESLARGADFANIESEGARVKMTVDEIKRKLGVFMVNIEELGVPADNCSRNIRRARTVILQRIIKHPQE